MEITNDLHCRARAMADLGARSDATSMVSPAYERDRMAMLLLLDAAIKLGDPDATEVLQLIREAVACDPSDYASLSDLWGNSVPDASGRVGGMYFDMDTDRLGRAAE